MSSVVSGEGIAADRVTVAFSVQGSRLVAVNDVSLSLAPGETLGLVGESGCGKTTLARALTGLVATESGEIRLDGRMLGRRRTPAERRAMQVVFQDPYSSLNPRLTVRSVLRELLAIHGLANGLAAEERCGELMNLVGLPGQVLDGQPVSLSGGQRQRVAIARALAVEPRFLILDEPTSALDVSVQATILALFETLRSSLGLGILMISHNLAAVRFLCERIAVMYLGEIIEVGTREEIFGDYRHPYTEALLAAAPRIRRHLGEPVRLRGEPPSATARPTGCAFHPRCPRAEEICVVESPPLLPASGTAALVACHFRDEHRADIALTQIARKEAP